MLMTAYYSRAAEAEELADKLSSNRCAAARSPPSSTRS
jgi:hypothetical protein